LRVDYFRARHVRTLLTMALQHDPPFLVPADPGSIPPTTSAQRDSTPTNASRSRSDPLRPNDWLAGLDVDVLAATGMVEVDDSRDDDGDALA
jgi:hypothetical protein